MNKPITASQLAKAQKIVNKWFDDQNYLDDPTDILHKWLNQPGYFPDGHPTLVKWENEGHPLLGFEGCALEEWAMRITDDIQPELDKIGVFAEPYYSFMLGLYPA